MLHINSGRGGVVKMLFRPCIDYICRPLHARVGSPGLYTSANMEIDVQDTFIEAITHVELCEKERVALIRNNISGV